MAQRHTNPDLTHLKINIIYTCLLIGRVSMFIQAASFQDINLSSNPAMKLFSKVKYLLKKYMSGAGKTRTL